MSHHQLSDGARRGAFRGVRRVHGFRGFRRRGFTLIELLVVVSIITLLIALLLPALAKARQSARITQCLSNIRQVGIGLYGYSNDSKDDLLATRFNISGGTTLAPDFSEVFSNTANSTTQPVHAGKWLDIVYDRYLNKNVGVLECPDQLYIRYLRASPTKVRLGYGLNEFVIHFADRYGQFGTSTGVAHLNRPHKYYEFQKPNQKVWAADTGLQNWHTDPPNGVYYGTYIRNFSSANTVFNVGISARHNNGLNLLFFDGHAGYGKYANYNVPSASASPIRGTYWSPTGLNGERNSSCMVGAEGSTVSRH